MVAKILRSSGLYVGTEIDDVVCEDNEIAPLLEQPERKRLAALICERNRTHSRWGFKRPSIQDWMRPEDLRMFRNPRLLLTFRDPVAIAQRNTISEYIPERTALQDAAKLLSSVIAFACAVDCPACLISYEKALSSPERLIDGVLDFCQVGAAETIRQELQKLVQPSPEDYLTNAVLRFKGVVDGIRNGTLFGWCLPPFATHRLRLILKVDGQAVKSFNASEFRGDLQEAGMGDGAHGFSVRIDDLPLSNDSAIRVSVEGRSFELKNSGLTVRQLQERVAHARDGGNEAGSGHVGT